MTEKQLQAYKDPERNKAIGKSVRSHWADPEYRKKMIEKQIKLGYRTYGRGLFYGANKR